MYDVTSHTYVYIFCLFKAHMLFWLLCSEAPWALLVADTGTLQIAIIIIIIIIIIVI